MAVGSLKSRLQGKVNTTGTCTLWRRQATGLKEESRISRKSIHSPLSSRTPQMLPSPQTPLGTWSHWPCLQLTPTLQTSPPNLGRRGEPSVDKAILILHCHSNFKLPSSSGTYYPTLKVWEKSLWGPVQVIQPLSCSHTTCKLKHTPTTHILQNVKITFRFLLYRDSST